MIRDRWRRVARGPAEHIFDHVCRADSLRFLARAYGLHDGVVTVWAGTTTAEKGPGVVTGALKEKATEAAVVLERGVAEVAAVEVVCPVVDAREVGHVEEPDVGRTLSDVVLENEALDCILEIKRPPCGLSIGGGIDLVRVNEREGDESGATVRLCEIVRGQ